MFDIRAIRETPDVFRKAWNRRKAGLGDETVSRILELDTAWRAATTAKQDAESARNTTSKQIGQAKAKKDEAEAARLMALVADAKTAIEAAEAEEKTKRAALDDLLMGLPNLPLDEVPEGTDEHGNVEKSRWGTPKGINNPKDHADLGEALKVPSGFSMMDFEAAAKMSGARFVALRGQLARMERALANFMLDIQTAEHGYQETSTPILVREQALLGTGQLPKFEEDMFKTTTGHYLISTSEISLTNLVREQVVEVSQLPIRMTAHTPCFRSEAGSAGRDTKGMIRQHQFYKVELVSIVAGEAEGLAELDRMTACAEEVLKRLELPFRRMLLCTGDMGAGARKTFDLEVWLPSQNTYREISSCSYCGDFQARRMDARYRVDAKSKLEFVHTLNGSGLAVGRTLVAVLENYQNADGSITVPAALRPYMGGVEVIR
ncbi:MAG: serine--tRNA ligase [Hyphomonas sp.]|uniref:serine--tRNA ligase n=1 Tax=Hyphomonas sp. TaxID=87 RepID=UPI0025BC196D|nr:serine--tRNA ligase [Hyphomonas sp.]MBA4337661.1 serine--tRNA ligase [Hyphomonas sp.]